MHADVSRRADDDAMVRRGDAPLRPPRRPLQQRRGADVGPAGRLHRGRSGTSRSPPTSRRSSGRAAPRSPHMLAGGGRQHHQHRVHARADRLRGLRRVRRGQGRARGADPPDRGRVRRRASAPTSSRPARSTRPASARSPKPCPTPTGSCPACARTIPLAPPRHGGGHRAHRAVPRQRRCRRTRAAR